VPKKIPRNFVVTEFKSFSTVSANCCPSFQANSEDLTGRFTPKSCLSDLGFASWHGEKPN